MKLVQPKIFLIAETQLTPGVEEFLSHLNVSGWDTNAPSDAEKLIEIAGKTCYMSFDTNNNKNLTKVRVNQNEEYIQKGLIEQKHTSVLEHASVSFALCDVSRVFTHELVRHRVGTGYSQESGRYVRPNELKVVIPNDTFTEVEHLKLQDILKHVEIMYKDLETQVFKRIDGSDFATKKKMTSALRRIFPNGQANTIIFTANHRILRQVIEARTSIHAEEEIRLVFLKVLSMLNSKFPNIYKDLADKLLQFKD